MRRLGAVFLACVALLALYLAAWPVPVDPVSWQAPQDEGLTGVFAANDTLAAAGTVDLGEYEGPEDIAVGHDGALYATTFSGAILRIDPDSHRVSSSPRTPSSPPRQGSRRGEAVRWDAARRPPTRRTGRAV